MSFVGPNWHFVSPLLIGAPDLDERLRLFGEALRARAEAVDAKGNDKKRHLEKARDLYLALGIDDVAEEVKKELLPFELSMQTIFRIISGTGRRKSAIARAWLRPGTGEIQVRTKRGSRDLREYFTSEGQLHQVLQPLRAVGLNREIDVQLNCIGGGKAGQAAASRRAISVALTDWNPGLRGALKDLGYLTSDSRKRERKKYGQKGARKKFQFSKR